MKFVHTLSQQIRDKVTGHLRGALMDSEEINREQVYCSLDIIEDTAFAIEAYRTERFPEGLGQRYLWLYGVLQCLVVQQDALRDLGSYFGLKLNPSKDEGAKKVRALRNSVVGHPTRQTQGVENGPIHNSIMRISMKRNSFKRLQASSIGSTIEVVELKEFFVLQDRYIEAGLSLVVDAVVSLASAHVQKYADQSLGSILAWTDEMSAALLRGETREVWRAVEEARKATLERGLETDLIDWHESRIQEALGQLDPKTPDTVEALRGCIRKYQVELSQMDDSFQRQSKL